MKIVSTQDKHVLEITYWPTDICNFNCDYCFPGSTPGINRYPKDLEVTLDQFNTLFESYRAKGKTKFNISIAGGGEPTIWPELGEFCKRIRDLADVELQIVSNASRTLRWWTKYRQYIDSVALSLHHKEVDINHFIQVCDLLYEAEVEVTAQVLMDPHHWDKCMSLLDKLYSSKHEWYIQLKEVIGHGKYTSEQMVFLETSLKRLEPSDRILKNLDKYNLIKSVQIDDNDEVVTSKMNTYILHNTNKFKGWTCSFPTERIAVDTVGNIKGSCGVAITGDTVVCPLKSCDCAPDTHVTKSQF